jgi:hypothetical protein
LPAALLAGTPGEAELVLAVRTVYGKRSVKRYKTFLATETKMIKAVEEVGPQCGVPAEVPKQLKAGHAKAQQIAKQVCDFAARGGRPARPIWDDLIGIRPTVADAQGERFRDWPRIRLPLEP